MTTFSILKCYNFENILKKYKASLVIFMINKEKEEENRSSCVPKGIYKNQVPVCQTFRWSTTWPQQRYQHNQIEKKFC